MLYSQLRCHDDTKKVVVPPTIEFLNVSHQNDKENFSKQIQVGNQEYKIPVHDKITINVADLPSNVEEPNEASQDQLHRPKEDNNVLENNQNVLPIPNNQSAFKTSTRSSNIKLSSKASLETAAPLKIPTVTPESMKEKSPGDRFNFPLQAPLVQKKVPEGVVPVQNQILPNEFNPGKVNDEINNR